MRAGYIYSESLARLADEVTPPPGRSSRVHALVKALELVHDKSSDGPDRKQGNTAEILKPNKACREDLLRFHSSTFLDAALNPPASWTALGTLDESDSSGEDSDSCASSASSGQKHVRRRSNDNYGLSADPPGPDYFLGIAGSSLTAAQHLCIPDATRSSSSETSSDEADHGGDTPFDIVFNWEGGRHHAMRDRAAGFCYVQDVGLAIDLLRRKGCVRRPRTENDDPDTSGRLCYEPQTPKRRPRIMYIDLDIHFGDGVASACRHPYRYSYPATAQQLRGPKPTVLTLSLHHYARGFFPANPEGGLTPEDTPTPFNLSIPLNAGVGSSTYARLMKSCVEPLKYSFDPDYVVLLLGMDALHGDDLVDGAGNWALEGEGGVAWTCEMIKGWNRRTLVLGGGGYNRLNTAKGWACATGVFLGDGYDAQRAVPEHDYWPEYGPDFGLSVSAGNTKDRNDEEHLRKIETTSEIWKERIITIMR